MIPPLNKWPPDLRYLYEERAGIKEFDGNTPRARAEREAFREVWAEYGPKYHDEIVRGWLQKAG